MTENNNYLSLDDAFSLGSEFQAPEVKPLIICLPASISGETRSEIVFPNPFTVAGAEDLADVITFVQEGMALETTAKRAAALHRDKNKRDEARAEVYTEFMGRYTLNHIIYLTKQWIGEDAYEELMEAKRPSFQEHFALLLRAGAYYLAEGQSFGDLRDFTASPTS